MLAVLCAVLAGHAPSHLQLSGGGAAGHEAGDAGGGSWQAS